jgi:hypothetical protein
MQFSFNPCYFFLFYSFYLPGGSIRKSRTYIACLTQNQDAAIVQRKTDGCMHIANMHADMYH